MITINDLRLEFDRTLNDLLEKHYLSTDQHPLIYQFKLNHKKEIAYSFNCDVMHAIKKQYGLKFDVMNEAFNLALKRLLPVRFFELTVTGFINFNLYDKSSKDLTFQLIDVFDGTHSIANEPECLTFIENSQIFNQKLNRAKNIIESDYFDSKENPFFIVQEAYMLCLFLQSIKTQNRPSKDTFIAYLFDYFLIWREMEQNFVHQKKIKAFTSFIYSFCLSFLSVYKGTTSENIMGIIDQSRWKEDEFEHMLGMLEFIIVRGLNLMDIKPLKELI